MRETAVMTSFTFDHFHLRSPDPEAAARVWVNALGATIRTRMEVPAGIRVVLDLCGLTLFLEQVPPGTAVPPAAPHAGLEHLGLGVPDLDAALASATAAGALLESGPSSPRPGLRIAFVTMPDGVRVELLERKG
ncbi:VOC family protein [Falsiroseomonas sp. HW251]|uniref:VOC family protein n=1 Tax=Falsiroseomonas sp. HW251 TaxID=3390998 RepID=UPI003D320EDA